MAKKTPKKNGAPPKDTGSNIGVLVPQPHGGALSPGNPGNKGGGRAPSVIRNRLADLRDLTLDELDRKLAAEELSDSDLVRLAALVTKHTVPIPKEIVDEGFLKELAEVVASVLMAHPDGEELLRAINDGWTPVVGRRM